MKYLFNYLLIAVLSIAYMGFILYTMFVIVSSYLGFDTPMLEIHYHYIWLSYLVYSLKHIFDMLINWEEIRIDKYYILPSKLRRKYYTKTSCVRKSLPAKIIKQIYICFINVIYIIRRRIRGQYKI